MSDLITTPNLAPVVDLSDERLYRDVERVHALGPRAVHELLLDLAGIRLCRTEIEALVARYAKADPAIVSALGADRRPAPPLHATPRARIEL